MNRQVDPFEILDIDRSEFDRSDQDERLRMVSRAYRRKAAKAHPDAGGSAEQFRLIAECKDTLDSPDLYAYWKENGSIGGPDAEQERIARIIRNTLDTMFEEVISAGDLDLETVDVNKFLIDSVDGGTLSLLEQQGECRRRLRAANKLRRTYKRKKSGVGFLFQVIDTKIEKLEADLKQFDFALDVQKKVREYLMEYGYEVKFRAPQPTPGNVMFVHQMMDSSSR